MARQRSRPLPNSLMMTRAALIPLAKGGDAMIGSSNDDIQQSELDRYGIERIPADVYLWQGYRYSNVADALAAAKRKS